MRRAGEGYVPLTRSQMPQPIQTEGDPDAMFPMNGPGSPVAVPVTKSPTRAAGKHVPPLMFTELPLKVRLPMLATLISVPETRIEESGLMSTTPVSVTLIEY